MERRTEEDAIDRRREAAIGSAASLRPNFKPKYGVTEAQVSKFQELHRKRLQIKAKSKVHKRCKGLADGKRSAHNKAMEGQELKDQEPSEPLEDSISHSVSEKRVGEFSSVEEGPDNNNSAGNMAAKRRQKLFWGLDTKERWERKSNM